MMIECTIVVVVMLNVGALTLVLLNAARNRRDMGACRARIEALASEAHASASVAQEAAVARQDALYRQMEALGSLIAIIEPQYPLPPMRGSAISPDMAVILASLVLGRKPKAIVELGSGVSTVIMAYCLRKIGSGHIYSLDHEERFAETTRRNLELHGLSSWATVYHAPLTATQAGGETWQWYDLAALDKDVKADLFFIDGPPRMLGPQSRYPALPLLVSRLTPSALVVLDDAAREGEKAVVERWLREFPGWQCEPMVAEKGAAILRGAA